MKSVGGQRNQRKANSEMRWSGKLEGTGREGKKENLKKMLEGSSELGDGHPDERRRPRRPLVGRGDGG